MSYMFHRILVAVDHYRRDAHVRRNAITVAAKLKAALQIVYMVDLGDIPVSVPGPQAGGARMALRLSTMLETEYLAEGREELDKFAASCQAASIEHSSRVFAGAAEITWAEEARCCDLVLILAAQRDFALLRRWPDALFGRIAGRSGRPVLILRRHELPTDRMVFFYSNKADSERALPWVAALAAGFDASLTVYVDRETRRINACENECKAFLDNHKVPATFEEKPIWDVLRGEATPPASEVDSPSLLVFDGGFRTGPWFGKRRRMVGRLIRASKHPILLCP